MALIKISNLTFSYESSYDNIFDDVSFQIDSNWKLGLVGRNGRGKTTLLKLLLGELSYYDGSISTSVQFDYFPFKIDNENQQGIDIIYSICPDIFEWQILKEVLLLDMQEEILYRPFDSLSGGEQTKLLLAALFLKENNFLLIDEPTNHLDANARETVSRYLKTKRGYILISHDRYFLDNCVDYILSINKSSISLERGNFTSFLANKQLQDNFEKRTNEKLKKEIASMEKSSKRTKTWSDNIEASKIGHRVADRGAVGHKAAKMMKRSKNIERRKNNALDEKKTLLKNLETYDSLSMNIENFYKDNIGYLNDVSLFWGEKYICKGISFEIKKHDKIAIVGGNGTGKSTLLKLLNDENISYSGDININQNLKISYIPQNTSYLKGNLDDFIYKHKLDMTKFKTILIKLDFSDSQFEKNMEEYSQGQRKKVLIAKSLCEEANIFLWDEVLNYIDIYSRIQIQNMILEYEPTMIFVEHDVEFVKKIANKHYYLEN